MPSDWFKWVVWLGTSNQIGLFQQSIVILCQIKFMTLAPDKIIDFTILKVPPFFVLCLNPTGASWRSHFDWTFENNKVILNIGFIDNNNNNIWLKLCESGFWKKYLMFFVRFKEAMYSVIVHSRCIGECVRERALSVCERERLTPNERIFLCKWQRRRVMHRDRSKCWSLDVSMDETRKAIYDLANSGKPIEIVTLVGIHRSLWVSLAKYIQDIEQYCIHTFARMCVCGTPMRRVKSNAWKSVHVLCMSWD